MFFLCYFILTLEYYIWGEKMKKQLLLLLALGAISQGAFGKEFIGKGNGYGGPLKVLVSTDNDKIINVELLSHKETSPVVKRAFPILKERILEAQSPIIDSVSGATYTSLGVKRAVAAGLKSAGKDYGRINMNTKAPEKPIAYLEPVNTDLVIVGGGPAGLAAAISAKENGVKNVILIEKLDILSGNGKFDMNFFDMINSEAQKKNGTNDTIEAFVKDKSNKMDTPERTLAQAKGAFVLDKWLRGMGIQLNHNYGLRNHMAEKDAYAGEEIQDGLEKRAKELGVDIRTSTKGLDLIINNGVITGVKVQNKNNFYDINGKAVVLATGGFSHNKELLAKYAPGAEKVETSNQMGATGDFLPIFEKHDLKVDNLDVLSVFAFIMVPSRDLTGGGDGFMLVNQKGERFTSEEITGKTSMEKANAILNQPGEYAYYIYDQNLYDSSYRLQKHTKLGLHIKAGTLEELAKKIDVPYETLKATREDFNSAIRGEKKDKFREVPFKREFKTEGPFYAAKVQSAIHMTKGGVVANENTEVLFENGKVAKGLYAAGEVTSSSAAYSASVVFGRLAGENAAKFILK
ncbi:fumarate reductase flavoprotein subunit [Cetobacterium ceti]|uniref:Fumarate reductase flavoprotein subunit n=2 Tax=Cetobacterium ceti TaxID=180163 RepID=A0A1T4NIU6_9FUSO|nr:fumarate reductase flavoprotein subunit [Cetobacterium ceti]